MGMNIRPLTKDFAASPQIKPGDVKSAVEQGYKTIINNRPDGEAWGQPKNADIEAEANAHGIDYIFLPINLRNLSPAHVEEMARWHERAEKPILAFCNTGTRSTILWALSQAGKIPADEIIQAAANAGYDVQNLRSHLVIDS